MNKKTRTIIFIALILILTNSISAYPTAPILSNKNLEIISDSEIKFTWTTDKNADTRIEYGTDSTTLNHLAASYTLTTSHEISLTGLDEDTYYYKLVSCDYTNTCYHSELFSFITGDESTNEEDNSDQDNNDNSCNNIAISNIEEIHSDCDIYINWETNIPSDSTVNYGKCNLNTAIDDNSLLTSHSIFLNALECETYYCYQIESCDENNICTYSDIYDFTTGSLTEIEISNIHSDSISTDSALIKWNTNIEGDSTIYFGTTSLALNEIITNSNYIQNHELQLNNLEDNKVYYYQVKSCDNSDNCDYSGIYSFTTNENQECPNDPCITNVRSEDKTEDSVNIKWETNVLTYSGVYYGTSYYTVEDVINNWNSINNWNFIYDWYYLIDHSINLPNLEETKYYYFVWACTEQHVCSYSEIHDFEIINNDNNEEDNEEDNNENDDNEDNNDDNSNTDTILPSINNLRAEEITTNSAHIKWETDEESNSYVYYGRTPSIESSNSGTSYINNHDISLSNLDSGTLYYYSVRSCDRSGNCAYSQTNTFTTDSIDNLEITNVREESITTSSARILWNTNLNSNSKIYYGTSPNSFTNSIENLNNVLNHQIDLSGLQENTIYYYIVQSCEDQCTTDGINSFTTLTTTINDPIEIIEPIIEEEEDTIIRISSFKINQDFVRRGDTLNVLVILENTAEFDYDEIEITASIQELDVRRKIGPFELEENDQIVKHIYLEIPYYATTNEYMVRLVVRDFETGLRRVKYRPVMIYE